MHTDIPAYKDKDLYNNLDIVYDHEKASVHIVCYMLTLLVNFHYHFHIR